MHHQKISSNKNVHGPSRARKNHITKTKMFMGHQRKKILSYKNVRDHQGQPNPPLLSSASSRLALNLSKKQEDQKEWHDKNTRECLNKIILCGQEILGWERSMVLDPYHI